MKRILLVAVLLSGTAAFVPSANACPAVVGCAVKPRCFYWTDYPLCVPPGATP